MNNEFLDAIANLIAEMRLMVEGAVSLYENDALPLNRLAMDAEPNAYAAFDSIGIALTELRENIRKLQKLHMEEAARLIRNTKGEEDHEA